MFLYFRIILWFDEEDGSNRFYFFRNCTHFGNLPLSQDSQLIQTFKHKVNNPQISWFISLNLIFILALASLLWWRNDCFRAAKCALCGGCDLRLRFVLCCATGAATPELLQTAALDFDPSGYWHFPAVLPWFYIHVLLFHLQHWFHFSLQLDTLSIHTRPCQA